MIARSLLIAAAAVLVTGGAAVAQTTPGSDFLTAWAGVDSYTSTVKAHESKGTDSQDRTYRYAFKKPSFAKIDIVDGSGKGGGAVWDGGDTVTGHQGGFLSGFKLKVNIHDGRATSLRGETIDRGSFQSVADDMKAGKVSDGGQMTVDGVPCEIVNVDYAAPADGVNRRTMAFSAATHMPVRRTTYNGTTVVKTEDFSDVKLNAGLKESDF